MKRTLNFFFLIFLFSGTLKVLAQEKTIRPEIKEATVFRNKAQLTSRFSTTLDAGTSELVLEGLPFSIDPQSIQVAGAGNFTIHSVKFEENYLDPHKKSPTLVILEDSLRFYQFQLDTYQDFEDVMKKEEHMLVSNQAINGKEKTLDADDLEYFANFYRKRLLDIRFQVLQNKRDIEEMKKNVQRVKNQINTVVNDNKPAGRIKIVAVSKSRVNAGFEVNYIVRNASWQPVYDIRVKDSDSPVSFTCKALVQQNTGINWKDVKLTLSTTNPALNGEKPELNPWYINIYEPVKANNRGRQNLGSPRPAMSEAYEVQESKSYDLLTAPKERFNSFETSLAVKFEINTPYTIPATQSGQVVDIQNINLDAVYKHFTTPKLSEAAYLVALISGYDDKNLLSGTANVYFEGTYIGKTFLDMNTTNDTLEVSLGKDNNVIVERLPVKELRSKSFLGLNKKEEFAYEIKVRNTKNSSIEIMIEDQVPVAQNSEIEVETIETSSGVKDDQTGIIVWKLNLPASETSIVKYRYSVKYPKNKLVKGLR